MNFRIFILIASSFLLFSALNAQSAFNYQFILRDANGNLQKEAPLDVEIKILKEGQTNPVYSENHSVTTNEFGSASLEVGNGYATYSTFNQIDWSTGIYYLKSSVNGVEFEKSKILMTPKAIYAEKAGNVYWEKLNSTSISSGQYDVHFNKDMFWYPRRNIKLFPDSLGLNEYSFDFANGDGTQRWSVWDPFHKHILTIRNSGKIGVDNIVDPEAPLHIRDKDANLSSGGSFQIGFLSGRNMIIDGNELMARDNGKVSSMYLQAYGGDFFVHSNKRNGSEFIIKDNGRIGSGTSTPEKQLHLKGDGYIKLEDTSAPNNSWTELNCTAAGNFVLKQHNKFGRSSFAIKPHGDMIFSSTNANVKFDFRGRVKTHTLEITGGADVVEKINSDDNIQPGEVILIDPTDPNKAMRSTKSYQRTAIGVVSGAGGVKHGVELAQEGALDGNIAFAIAGRVYVKVTGQVQPGDLLTSSDIPGKAMAAIDREKREGAVIGKALTPVNDEGMVLMLVMNK